MHSTAAKPIRGPMIGRASLNIEHIETRMIVNDATTSVSWNNITNKMIMKPISVTKILKTAGSLWHPIATSMLTLTMKLHAQINSAAVTASMPAVNKTGTRQPG